MRPAAYIIYYIFAPLPQFHVHDIIKSTVIRLIHDISSCLPMARPPCLDVSWLLSLPRLEGLFVIYFSCRLRLSRTQHIWCHVWSRVRGSTVFLLSVVLLLTPLSGPRECHFRVVTGALSCLTTQGCDHIRPLMVMMCIICDRPPDLFRLAESLSPEPFLWCSQLDMVS